MTEPSSFGMTSAEMASAATVYADNLFDGKRILISGAGSGIGKAMAWLFARLGAHVIMVGRTLEKLQAVEAALAEQGYKAESYALDIRDAEAVQFLFNELWWKGGHIDVLVNSAGGQFPQHALDFSANGWKAVVDTNLNGTWFMMQAAAQQWLQEGLPGNIVNIVTVINRGMPGVAHTCAARAGVIYASKSVAVEWAPHNIRINCVAPGITDTEGMDVYPKDAVARFTDSNPMRRFASAWEVAEAAAFLSSDASRFMTGEVMIIDGGGTLWGELWTKGKPDYFKSAPDNP